MSVTQYRHSVLQKHWSNKDAFSLQQLEKQIKNHKDIFKRHSYEETIMIEELGEPLMFG